jgi:hypothetical protein
MAPTLGFERSTLNMVGACFPDLAPIRNKSGLPEASGQPFRHLPAAE